MPDFPKIRLGRSSVSHHRSQPINLPKSPNVRVCLVKIASEWKNSKAAALASKGHFMTEREKMLAGEPYQSRDAELLALYHRTKALLQTFAGAPSTDTAGKQEILRSLFGSVGSIVWIESPFACDYGVNIHIGDDCFINYNCVFLDSHQITIGTFVLIGPAVQLYTAGHPLSADERIVWDEQ